MTQDYTIRHYRLGEEQRMADLVNASQAEEDGFVVTDDMIHDEWTDPRLELERDTWVAVDEAGNYLAVAEVWFEEQDEAEEEEAVTRHVGFTMRPDCRESHAEVMEELFARAVAHASSRPMEPGKPYYLRAWASANDEWKQRWILDHGFDYIHCGFTMLREKLSGLPAPPQVPGIRIERWSPERDYDLWRTLNEAFRDDDSFLPLSWQEWNDIYHQPGRGDPSLWRLAIDSEQEEVVGFAFAEVVDLDPNLGSPLEGWVTDLAVIERWQDAGVRQALLLSALHGLRDAGINLALIGVDSAEPDTATQLYESLGFRVLRGSCTFHKLISPPGGA